VRFTAASIDYLLPDNQLQPNNEVKGPMNADSEHTSTPSIYLGEGVNASEYYLKKLCDRTFLRLWSYPGVYRDQGDTGRGGSGKELTDLLVVFREHMIIFSDKDCGFGDTGDLHLDWSRWFRKSVLASAKQIYGAERWIRDHPDRLFLDPGCTQPFPIPLPSLADAKIHRVAVAHASSERCRREIGGNGSLTIVPSVIGDAHFDTKLALQPFVVGQLDPVKGFVHVLDDISLEAVLTTLDTITDLTSYLIKKEKLISEGHLLCAAGEEELLGSYLSVVDEDGEHDFLSPETAQLAVDEGFWHRFRDSPERKAQIEADKISYGWDALIEGFTTHAFDGTQYYSSDPGLQNTEKILRFLAAESRLRRRLLSQAYYSFIAETHPSARRGRLVARTEPGEPCYVFLALPKPGTMSEDEYRVARREILTSYCMVAKLHCPDTSDFVGIATEPGCPELRSEDAIYYDASSWSPEEKAEAERLHSEGVLNKTKAFGVQTDEYPAKPAIGPEADSIRRMNGRDRNSQCPCGSGLKFKRCCGK